MGLKVTINKYFFKSDEIFLMRMLLFPLELLSYFYATIILIRNILYKYKILKEKKLKSFVISVGNLTTGGSGKTPVVIAIAQYLKSRGYSVGVVARSYKGKKHESFCLYDDNLFYSASLYGDEPVLLKKKLKETPVFAGKNKTELALKLEKAFSPDFIVIDDAFSHRKIARNIDILIFDNEMGIGNGYLLPRGPLREPLSSIKRADVILFKTIDEKNVHLQIKKDILQSFPVYRVRIQRESIRSILNESEEVDLNNKKFIAFCGIGNSNSFLQILLINRLKFCDFIEFEDHFHYDINTLRSIDERAIKNQCEIVLCTEKDAVKIIELLRKIETKSLFCYMSINAVIDHEFYEILEKEIEDHGIKGKKKSGLS